MKFSYLTPLVAMACLALAPACSDEGHMVEPDDNSCDAESRADTIVAGLEKAGEGAMRVVLVEATPASPAKGDNDWRIQVFDAADNTLEGLTVGVKPWMPDHGHGANRPAVVTEIEGATGEYMLSPLNLWMPGYWEITIDLDDGDGTVDEVMFPLCIEG